MKLIQLLTAEQEKGIPLKDVEFSRGNFDYKSALWSIHAGCYYMLRKKKDQEWADAVTCPIKTERVR